MAESILEDVFMNIPTPIIADILARLPPKSVIRCSCVCKPWLKLISEPEFVNLHLSKSPTCLIVHKDLRFDSFNLVEVEDETDHHSVRPIAGTDRDFPRIYKKIMIGSIDGLVCIHGHPDHSELIHVWNPIMREFITSQTPGGVSRFPSVTTYGFGISSGKYLVVKIFQEMKDSAPICPQSIRNSTCYVYTIGDGVWKSIGHAPYMYNGRQHGLFLNGNLHWLIYDKDDIERICCLELEKELFRPFSSPREVCQDNLSTLNVYKGCLSMCDNTSNLDVVIWVMKEYGVQNSWTKELVISKHLFDPHLTFDEVVHIIKVFKDGEILLLWDDHVLFSYHPKWKTVQKIDVEESMTGPFNNNNRPYIPLIKTIDYVPSIVSLKSLGEVNVNRI